MKNIDTRYECPFCKKIVGQYDPDLFGDKIFELHEIPCDTEYIRKDACSHLIIDETDDGIWINDDNVEALYKDLCIEAPELMKLLKENGIYYKIIDFEDYDYEDKMVWYFVENVEDLEKSCKKVRLDWTRRWYHSSP